MLHITAYNDPSLDQQTVSLSLTRVLTILASPLVKQNFSVIFCHSLLPLLLRFNTAGDYIAILSTFAPEHRGKATLEVSSLQEVALENVPQEGAGMHLISVTGCWCVQGCYHLMERLIHYKG